MTDKSASNAQDYGRMILRSDDRHPIKRHLSLFARRRLRRTIALARDPMPWVERNLAALALRNGHGMRVRESQGYALLPNGFISNVGPVIELAHRKWHQYRDQMAATNDYFLKFTRFMPEEEIAEAADIVVQESLLKLTSDYLGGVPILKDLNIWWTRPWTRVEGAQNYHIDSIPDTRSLRIFVALTDVDQDSGPLNFIPADKSAAFIHKIGYLGGTVDSARLLREVGEDSVVVAACKQGGAVAVDTGRCFHLGSRDMKKDRLVLSISFSSAYLNEEIGDQTVWRRSAGYRNKVERLVFNRR